MLLFHEAFYRCRCISAKALDAIAAVAVQHLSQIMTRRSKGMINHDTTGQDSSVC